jgi:citrate synthase
VIDIDPTTRAEQALRVAAMTPSILAALHRTASGLDTIEPDPTLGHTASYLYETIGALSAAECIRAVEQYMILTIDHGFNASTFTARVVASTGADVADAVCAAIGALAGPLHGGAPSRALDALDAIGTPERAPQWVRGEVAAGRRIMGFGHAVYRAPDPRSGLLREVAEMLGGPLVERAVAIEAEILVTLAELKPGRPLPSNVEFYAGVVMETAGLPRQMFTPTFAVSRMVGWTSHVVEQAAVGKLIRPTSRYTGPPLR